MRTEKKEGEERAFQRKGEFWEVRALGLGSGALFVRHSDSPAIPNA